MTELKTKLLETKSLIFGGALVIVFTVLAQLAQSTVLLAQLIPCFLIYGQPEMPEALQQSIKDRELQ